MLFNSFSDGLITNIQKTCKNRTHTKLRLFKLQKLSLSNEITDINIFDFARHKKL